MASPIKGKTRVHPGSAFEACLYDTTNRQTADRPWGCIGLRLPFQDDCHRRRNPIVRRAI
jgi:hypothetical protein